MIPSQALKHIIKDYNSIIDDEVSELYAELIRISPVGETGNFRSSWSLNNGYFTTTASKKWTISNYQEYASILAGGRRNVNGMTIGSIQWSAGLSPMLQKSSNNLKRRLGNVNY